MEFGICHLNCIAVRQEASNRSEMLSQMLFGETFQVIQKENEWVKIQLEYDYYEGWVMLNQVTPLTPDTFEKLTKEKKYYSADMATFVHDQDERLQILTLGAVLPAYQNGKFHLGDHDYDFDGDIVCGKMSKSNLVMTAYKFLNAPYLWGGRTPFGVDCSGFTQMVYKINGYQLFRDAHQQASQGEVLSFIEECEPGDLAFFDNEEGEITHTGIVLANNYIIHCHGKVRIDRIDSSGIYNADTNRHTHKLRVMKQLF